MTYKTLAEIRAQRPHVTDQEIERAREDLRAELHLDALREYRGISQTAVAEALQVSRPRVSAIENAGEDLRLSTVQRYIEALGGQLEIRAVFPDDEPIAIIEPERRSEPVGA